MVNKILWGLLVMGIIAHGYFVSWGGHWLRWEVNGYDGYLVGGIVVFSILIPLVYLEGKKSVLKKRR